MARKDVTPRKRGNGSFKKFGIGLLGGLVGGMLAIGLFFYATDGVGTNSSGTTEGNTDTSGNVQVSNVQYDVDSDVTSRSEEHTSELQSRFELVFRLL